MTWSEKEEIRVREKYRNSGETFSSVLESAKRFLYEGNTDEAIEYLSDAYCLSEETHHDYWELYLASWLFMSFGIDDMWLDIIITSDKAVELAPKEEAQKYMAAIVKRNYKRYLQEERTLTITLFYKMIELKKLSGLKGFTTGNKIENRAGKRFSMGELKCLLSDTSIAYADEVVLDYLKKQDVYIHADEEDFNGKNGFKICHNDENERVSTFCKCKGYCNCTSFPDNEFYALIQDRGSACISGKMWVEVQEMIASKIEDMAS